MGLRIDGNFNYKGQVFNGVYVAIQLYLNRKNDSVNTSLSYYFSKAAFEANESNNLEVNPDMEIPQNINIEYNRTEDGVDLNLIAHNAAEQELTEAGYTSIVNELDV